jgi:PBP1b-binding outer membrane lipoprotein LpoB
MIKIKKIALLTMIPAFAIVLSGCGQPATPQNQVPMPAKQSDLDKQAQPTQTADAQKDPSATPAPLAPLPADNKQAIDSEIQGIDQELQATDTTLSTDTTDASLGL